GILLNAYNSIASPDWCESAQTLKPSTGSYDWYQSAQTLMRERAGIADASFDLLSRRMAALGTSLPCRAVAWHVWVRRYIHRTQTWVLRGNMTRRVSAMTSPGSVRDVQQKR